MNYKKNVAFHIVSKKSQIKAKEKYGVKQEICNE